MRWNTVSVGCGANSAAHPIRLARGSLPNVDSSGFRNVDYFLPLAKFEPMAGFGVTLPPLGPHLRSSYIPQFFSYGKDHLETIHKMN
ncbi:hypothetical protein TNCT_362961 [Trichonephila clavata]|uniref:Uncharacterized protein n=1 Tax=Trichonephila clavata TaxID=2740835 RepID=A0A8X6I6S5_TRICU|nr:hypothetical protein TNCT_362961 [Trichonephila clavata]